MTRLQIKLPDLKVSAEREPEPVTWRDRMKPAWRWIVGLAFLAVGINLFWIGLDGLPPWAIATLRLLAGASLIYRAICKLFPTKSKAKS